MRYVKIGCVIEYFMYMVAVGMIAGYIPRWYVHGHPSWEPAVVPNMSHCQITRSTRFAREVGITKPNPNPNRRNEQTPAYETL